MKALLICGAIFSTINSLEEKINSLNILMPLIYESFDKRTVQYELEAYGGGCYDWRSS